MPKSSLRNSKILLVLLFPGSFFMVSAWTARRKAQKTPLTPHTTTHFLNKSCFETRKHKISVCCIERLKEPKISATKERVCCPTLTQEGCFQKLFEVSSKLQNTHFHFLTCSSLKTLVKFHIFANSILALFAFISIFRYAFK
mgnify:CR=1 FL=1